MKRPDEEVRRTRSSPALGGNQLLAPSEIRRETADSYLARSEPDVETALVSTVGRLPRLGVPSRNERDRG